jgi:hypothetical protein
LNRRQTIADILVLKGKVTKSFFQGRSKCLKGGKIEKKTYLQFSQAKLAPMKNAR